MGNDGYKVQIGISKFVYIERLGRLVEESQIARICRLEVGGNIANNNERDSREA